MIIEFGRHAKPFPSRLTTSREKEALFSVDTYFTESWGQLLELTERPLEFAWEHGILVLKPDAFAARCAHVILEWLIDERFEIAAAVPIRFDRHAIRALWRYQWNMATPERKDLFDLLLAGAESVLVVVRRFVASGWPATVLLTDAKGPADIASRLPHHLRSRLSGNSSVLTYLHTADEPADVVRELGVHLDRDARERLVGDLLQGDDASEEARQLCNRVYQAIPAHSLDTVEIAARLEELQGKGGGRLSSDLRLICRSLRRREPVDLGELRALCARCEAPLSRWDEIVVRAAQITASIPGIHPVLRTRARDWDGISTVQA